MLALLSVQTTEEEADRRAQLLEQLLIQVGQGSQEAFTQLYGLTRGAVYALALSLLHNSHEAQDIAQDTFVKVWETAPAYLPQGSPMAWLLTVTKNLALSRLRRSGRQVNLEEAEWNAIPAQDPSVSPEDRQLLQESLAKLGAEERRIVLLHAVTGLKHREIAQLLEQPLSTVLSKYYRGLGKLRSLMKGESDR